MVMQHIIQHKNFLPKNIVYGFIGKHPDLAIHKYRDHNDAVKNRDAVLNLLGNDQLSMSLLKQVHGVNCAELKYSEDINYDYEGDAQVTKSRNIILAVQTADCVPILFFDQVARVVAAAHAGWKGALDGVVDSTLQSMQEMGANIDDIITIIGPCIRQESYEVSGDFINQFLLEDMDNSEFFKKNTKNKGKYFFDLPGYVKKLLAKAYVNKIYDVDIDTRVHPNFFSYRQACLLQKKRDGDNLSFIGLTT